MIDKEHTVEVSFRREERVLVRSYMAHVFEFLLSHEHRISDKDFADFLRSRALMECVEGAHRTKYKIAINPNKNLWAPYIHGQRGVGIVATVRFVGNDGVQEECCNWYGDEERCNEKAPENYETFLELW